MEKLNLGRAVVIFLSKNGVFKFARQGTRAHRDLLRSGFLPAASVNAIADAKSLQVAKCKLSYDGERYIYPMEPTLDGLFRAAQELDRLYLRRRSGKPGWPTPAEVA